MTMPSCLYLAFVALAGLAVLAEARPCSTGGSLSHNGRTYCSHNLAGGDLRMPVRPTHSLSQEDSTLCNRLPEMITMIIGSRSHFSAGRLAYQNFERKLVRLHYSESWIAIGNQQTALLQLKLHLRIKQTCLIRNKIIHKIEVATNVSLL